MGLLSWLFRRGRAQAAVAEPPSAPAESPPAPAESPPAGAEPPPAEAETEPEVDGEISPSRLDAALQRLRAEHPAAPDG